MKPLAPAARRITIRKIFGLAAFVSCAAIAGVVPFAVSPAMAQQQAASERDNKMLNDGYSLLYQAVSGLRFSDELLIVKVETKPVERVVDNVAAMASGLKDDLDRLAKDYPAVRIDQKPLPEMEQRRRAAVTKDRLLSYAPLAGPSGPAFERTLLLSTSGALNQTLYLCQVMAEIEPDPQLKKFLQGAERKMARSYDQVVVLLNSDYFKDNTYRPPKR